MRRWPISCKAPRAKRAANGKTAGDRFRRSQYRQADGVSHHLRSSIIGDCLQRLYRANGWRVISDVHLGDWGLQMGQLISEIGAARPGAGLFRRRFQWSVPGGFPGDDGRSGGNLSGGLRRLQGRSGAAGSWRAAPRWICRMAAPAIAPCGGISSRSAEAGPQPRIPSLGVTVRSVERRIQRRMTLVAPMLEDLKARGFAEISEGALVVPVSPRRATRNRCRR